MDVKFCPDEPTELHTNIGARNVIEAGPVKGTDFHVFYWLGLDGKIRCLPGGNRNQTGRGAEEEAFHHLHLEPPIVVSWEGSVYGRVNCTPEGPLVPKNSSGLSTPRKHRTNRLG